MDAPSLSPERSRELADLRRRAYGPDADIQRDPVAQRRLYELEDLARMGAMASEESDGPSPEAAQGAEELAEPASPWAAEDDPEPAGAESPQAVAPDEPVDAPDSPDAPSPTTEVLGRPWWRRIPLWSVTAVVGIAAGLAFGLAWPSDAEPPPDVTLEVEPDGGERGDGFAENLDYWGIDGGSVVPHEAFDGIQVWTARAVDESRCLMLSHDGSFLSATCSGAGLDPILDFTIYEGMSIELDEPLPVGTVIRFVGREGHVDVWVRTPGGQGDAAPTTSRRDAAPSAA